MFRNFMLRFCAEQFDAILQIEPIDLRA